MLHAVVMAGGSGTRFWPASRIDTPKQLLNLTGDRSMIQSTVARLGRLVPQDRVLVVTNQRLVAAIQEQLPELPPNCVIGEPCRRDTAACIGLAAAWVARTDDEAIIVVMPADHVIQPAADFQSAIQYAAELVREEPSRLVTFGIKPSYPAESFGYIERDQPVTAPSVATISPPTFRVRQFREKPKADVARGYVESGQFYWNSGIFVWNARTILTALAKHEPDLHSRLVKIAAEIDKPRFDEVFAREFQLIKRVSIDYAVMEKAAEVVVIEAPFGWDDVGSWQAISRLNPVDDNGNTRSGKTLCLRTTGSIVRTDDEHLVATLGIEDCIIVRTPNATLVARKQDEEQVREIVQQLGELKWDEYL